MKKTLIKFFYITLIVVVSSDFIYGQFNMDGEFRPRFEFRDGYKIQRDSITEPAYIITQRSRINLNYKNDYFSSCFSIQDVRVWGESKYKTDQSATNIHEAWVDLIITDKLSTRLGRQQIKYDDQRLLAGANWNNVSATHDLALFKFANNAWDLHLGLAYNNDTEKQFESYYPIDYYKTLSFIWLQKEINDSLRFSLIDIADGYQSDKDGNPVYLRNTIGGNLWMENYIPCLDVHLEAYRQHGTDKTGKEINAWFFSGLLKYHFLSKKVNFSVGYDYFTGNDTINSSSDVNKSFSNLYGAGHSKLGSMDYFTIVDKHTKGAGLRDLYAKIDYKYKAVIFNMDYHLFCLNASEIENNYLGSELDFGFSFTKNEISLKAGYSVMFASSTMDLIKSGDNNHFSSWAWMMITLKPKFL